MRPRSTRKRAVSAVSALFAVSLLLAGGAALAQNAANPTPVKAEEGVWGEWGEATDGLRIGLFLQKPGREFHYGDILRFTLRAWNVSEKDFERTIRPSGYSVLGLRVGNWLLGEGGAFGNPIPFHLRPSQVADIPNCAFKVRLVSVGGPARPGIAGENATSLPLLPGKYTLECRLPIWMVHEDNPNSATAHRAKHRPFIFTVLPDRQERPIQRPRLDLPQPNVLWGDTVNGLQSGIAIAPDARIGRELSNKMVFQHWVRNSTDRAFTISYRKPADNDWYSPVTDAEGKPVSVHPLMVMSGMRLLQQVTLTLQPGEPVILEKAILQLVQEGAKPAANDYSPRMTAKPGVYNLSLVESVGMDGVSILCQTPKLKFTIPPR